MNTGSYFGYIGQGQYLNGIAAGHAIKIEEARLRRRQADPAGAAQHQLLPARRALGRSDDHLPGDLHRRMVAGRQGGGSHQRAGRPGRRRHHLPRRQPEGRRRDRRRPRRLRLRLPRQPGPLAPEKYLTGAEWNWAKVYKMFAEKLMAGEPLPNFVRGGLADGFVKISPLGPAVARARRASSSTPTRPRS